MSLTLYSDLFIDSAYGCPVRRSLASYRSSLIWHTHSAQWVWLHDAWWIRVLPRQVLRQRGGHVLGRVCDHINWFHSHILVKLTNSEGRLGQSAERAMVDKDDIIAYWLINLVWLVDVYWVPASLKLTTCVKIPCWQPGKKRQRQDNSFCMVVHPLHLLVSSIPT